MEFRDYLTNDTQQAVAVRARTSRPLINRIAKGEPPSFETAFRIRCATGGKVDYRDLERLLLERKPELRELLDMLPAEAIRDNHNAAV